MAYQADQTRAAASQSACLGLMFELGAFDFQMIRSQLSFGRGNTDGDTLKFSRAQGLLV